MLYFKKTDIAVILILLLLSAGGYAFYQAQNAGASVRAEIYYGSELVKTVDLTEGVDRVFSVPQDEHVIFHQYADGSIRFEASDCPDQVCVQAGKQRGSGDFAACLPNDLILKIVTTDGPSAGEPDIKVN